MTKQKAELLLVLGLAEQDSSELIWLPIHDKKMNWYDAIKYAKSIGCRLSTREEFILAYKDGIKFEDNMYFWSSESFSNGGAWFFFSYVSNIIHGDSSSRLSVRCVLNLNNLT